MCEIYVAVRASGLTERDVREVFEGAVIPSAGMNGDGFGWLTEGAFLKTERKASAIFTEPVLKSCVGKRFAAFHTRISTGSAHTAANAHPFIYPGIAVLHNGIIREVPDETAEVDSDRFASRLSKMEGRTFTERFRKAAKGCTGWASLLMYDSKFRGLYYFRNSGAQFEFSQYGDLTIGGTKASRLQSLFVERGKLFKDPKVYGEPVAGTLYWLDIKSGTVKPVGKADFPTYGTGPLSEGWCASSKIYRWPAGLTATTDGRGFSRADEIEHEKLERDNRFIQNMIDYGD